MAFCIVWSLVVIFFELASKALRVTIRFESSALRSAFNCSKNPLLNLAVLVTYLSFTTRLAFPLLAVVAEILSPIATNPYSLIKLYKTSFLAIVFLPLLNCATILPSSNILYCSKDPSAAPSCCVTTSFSTPSLV